MSRACGHCGFHDVGRGTTRTRRFRRGKRRKRGNPTHSSGRGRRLPVELQYTLACRSDWTRSTCVDPIRWLRLRVLSLERANPLALDPTQGRTMRVPRSLASRAVVAAASASFALSGIAAPALADGERDTPRTYVQTNLVSDVPGLAAHTDPNLRNPWGTSTGPGLPIWVSDNATGVTTLYDGQGNLKEVAANQPADHGPPARCQRTSQPGPVSTMISASRRTRNGARSTGMSRIASPNSFPRGGRGTSRCKCIRLTPGDGYPGRPWYGLRHVIDVLTNVR